MRRPDKHYIKSKMDFIKQYVGAINPATGSKIDSNANITSKSIATLEGELAKDVLQAINFETIKSNMSEYDAKCFDKDCDEKLIYLNDSTSLKPYCVSISMYPFILDGMKSLGNKSGSSAPKHLRSFCGGFVNLVQYVASQFAGAVATVEFLMYFDYFARKDFGDDYLETSKDVVEQELQGVVYLLNQDSAARNGQSVFHNLSTFDEPFFYGIFGEFVFPDFSKPSWESLDKLQRFFHKWFREERKKKLLTFPVVTHAAIVNGSDWVDKSSKEFIAKEMSEGGEFFIYTSDSADSLASCCRLKNELQDNTFSYSLGAGGVATGSKNVITINVNRCVQTGVSVFDVVKRVHKYHLAYNKYLHDMYDNDMLPVYKAQYITLDKQFLTIGLNGIVEAAEYLGYEISNNTEYKEWLSGMFEEIKQLNKEAKKLYGEMFNCEIVPAESLGIKNAKWDKKDGIKSSRDCYNSYFYKVEDKDISIFDKMILHGKEIVAHLDGGSALHYNHSERHSYKQYIKILEALAKTGCNYFCENVKKTVCNECGYIHADTKTSCIKCGSDDVKYATRIIGYLKFVENFSEDRQVEESKRSY